MISLYVFTHSNTSVSQCRGMLIIFRAFLYRVARYHDTCFSPLVHLQLALPQVRAIFTRPPATKGSSWSSLVSLEQAVRSCSGRCRRCLMEASFISDMLKNIRYEGNCQEKNECEFARLLPKTRKGNIQGYLYRLAKAYRGIVEALHSPTSGPRSSL